MAVQELRFTLGLLGSGGSGCICPEGSAAAWPRRCRASVISFTLSHMIDLFGCNDAMSALGVRGPHPGRRCLLVAELTLGGAASLCGIDSARRWVASAHQQPGGTVHRCLAAAFVDGAMGARVCTCTMFFAGRIREEDLCYGVVTGSGVTCWRR